MDNESDLEKTEQPSQRRLDQAHEEGQVARSRELSTFMALLAGGGGLWFMGEHLRQSLLRLVRQGLSFDAGVATDPARMMERFSRLSLETVEVFLPFLGLLLVTAIFSPLLLNGWLFSFKPLQPNFSRLDPLAGIGRMFSAQGGGGIGQKHRQGRGGGRGRGLGCVALSGSDPDAFRIVPSFRHSPDGDPGG